MILLFKIGLRYGKRYLLLGLTFVFMGLLTLANNAEIMALGVVTGSGADAFVLFGRQHEGKLEPVSELRLHEVEQRWGEIDVAGRGKINKSDAAAYIAKYCERNPLKRWMAWSSEKLNWRNDLSRLALLLIVVALVKAVSLFGSQYTKQMVTIKVGRDLRERYFAHIQTLSMDFYHKYNVGSLIGRLQGDATLIAAGVNAALTTYVQTPIMVGVSLIGCFLLSVKLSLVMFVAFPLLVLPILYFARRLKRLARSQQRLGEGFMGTLVDLISGIQTTKLFAMEGVSARKFRRFNQRSAQLEVKGARYGHLSRPVMHLASTLLLAGLILYGLFAAHMPVSEILVFCGLVYLMYEPIKRLNDENQHIQRGIAAAERMQEVLSLKPLIADRPHAKVLRSFQRSIEFRDVWFRYGEDWILRGVSFAIERGQTVALVGPTGGGKSTIAQLLPRLYDPERGEILFDGEPLTAYTQRSLRQQIAFVPQKPFLFMDSVAENIAFGSDISGAQIELAARHAHAHEFIEQLKQGYDTILSERGNSLSGGQQQRLAIARALCKQAPILVMDEATSSLDAVSEAKIKQAVAELRGKITQVLIAHRLSTVEDAHKIIFIDQGRVRAQGTKDQLLATCPEFRQMWDTMFRSGLQGDDQTSLMQSRS